MFRGSGWSSMIGKRSSRNGPAASGKRGGKSTIIKIGESRRNGNHGRSGREAKSGMRGTGGNVGEGRRSKMKRSRISSGTFGNSERRRSSTRSNGITKTTRKKRFSVGKSGGGGNNDARIESGIRGTSTKSGEDCRWGRRSAKGKMANSSMKKTSGKGVRCSTRGSSATIGMLATRCTMGKCTASRRSNTKGMTSMSSITFKSGVSGRSCTKGTSVTTSTGGMVGARSITGKSCRSAPSGMSARRKDKSSGEGTSDRKGWSIGRCMSGWNCKGLGSASSAGLARSVRSIQWSPNGGDANYRISGSSISSTSRIRQRNCRTIRMGRRCCKWSEMWSCSWIRRGRCVPWGKRGNHRRQCRCSRTVTQLRGNLAELAHWRSRAPCRSSRSWRRGCCAGAETLCRRLFLRVAWSWRLPSW
mmetsp:Transcript_44330/g.122702  ORF Transcript_44330/g.122702 Transcript_44330/m.122702 type:complete len:416 (+) Transcript_44330:89-1336(+)